MSGRVVFPLAALCGLVAGCSGRTPGIAPVEASVPPLTPADRAPTFDDESSVWGVADLHAHPAGHLALGGNPGGTGGILFGEPDIAAQSRGRVDLDRADSCDGEAHVVATTDLVTRLTHSLAFPIIGGSEGHRAHLAMHGDGDAPFEAWPNAADIYHQQMYVEMIRRAYEGGLRLMFASVTENQSLSRLMSITLAPGGLDLDPSEDLRSAEEQLRFIQQLVHENSDFMAVVTSPAQAREVIRENRLALVLGLELDYVPIEDVRRFHDDFGVRTIVPIHLADSPVGGAAAYTPVFNMHNALFGHGLGAPGLNWYALMEDSCVDRRAEPPLFPELLAGVVVLPVEMGWRDYVTDVGYESCDAASCSFGVTDGSVRARSLGSHGFGHRNRLGVRNAAYILELMRMGMLVDVAHMSIASASDTIALGERWGYPILDTHTGVSAAGGRVGQDRDLPLGLARRIHRGGGLVGMGTGPSAAVLGVLYHAVGAPLWSIDASGVQTPSAPLRPRAHEETAVRCTAARFARADRVTITGPSCPGTCTGNFDLGALRVTRCDGSVVVVAVPADGVVELPGSTSRLAELEVGTTMLEPWCAEACVPAVQYTSADANGVCPAGVCSASGVLEQVTLGIDGGPECYVHLGANAPTTASVSWRCDAEPVACFGPSVVDVPVRPWEPARWFAVAPVSGRILRVRARLSGNTETRVRGASANYAGTDVSLQIAFSGVSDGVPATVPVSMNHRGLWIGGTEYYEYVFLEDGYVGATVDSIAVVVDRGGDPRPATFSLDEIVVEDIEDPLLSWAAGYARVRAEIAAAAPTSTSADAAAIPALDVALAIGTDLNGFAPQIPLSSLDVAPGFQLCSSATGACEALRLRDRGLASYAMLADFFEGVRLADARAGRAGPERAVYDALFSSAEATIRAWERAEAAAGGVGP